MSGDNDALAIVGLIAAVALGVATTTWWLAVPAGIVLALCVLAAIPVGGGGVPVVPERPPDETERLLRSIERSQWSD